MRYFEIHHMNYESVVINEVGEVVARQNTVQGDLHNMSGNWEVTGLWFKKAFGHLGFLPLEAIVENHKELDYKYKNGKPRYGFTDVDHGTPRVNGRMISNITEVEWIDGNRNRWMLKL